MSRLLTVARVVALIVITNFISGTFMVICSFQKWDIIATIVTIALSAAVVHIEITNKWNCIGKEAFTNSLIVCVLLGGASSFFWFFHMIYKIGHYQGDYAELLWSTPTRIIAFGMSVQLILRAYRIYTSLTLELIDEILEDDVTPLSKTNLYTKTNTNSIIKNNNNINNDSNPV